MEKEEIHITDIHRIVFGETPPEFFIEVVIRIAFIYLLLMVSMRLMGKRMASALSRTEQASIVSLAAAVGMPLQTPDRGLLPALVIAVIVVACGRVISYFSLKSAGFENLVQDHIGLLVKDSVMQLKHMKRIAICRERLFAQLRSEGIKNLGEVKRLYIEANGTFTVIKHQEPVAGLSILPDWDSDFLKQQKQSLGDACCSHCGYKETKNINKGNYKCPVCKKSLWTEAYLS